MGRTAIIPVHLKHENLERSANNWLRYFLSYINLLPNYWRIPYTYHSSQSFNKYHIHLQKHTKSLKIPKIFTSSRHGSISTESQCEISENHCSVPEKQLIQRCCSQNTKSRVKSEGITWTHSKRRVA